MDNTKDNTKEENELINAIKAILSQNKTYLADAKYAKRCIDDLVFLLEGK